MNTNAYKSAIHKVHERTIYEPSNALPFYVRYSKQGCEKPKLYNKDKHTLIFDFTYLHESKVNKTFGKSYSGSYYKQIVVANGEIAYETDHELLNCSGLLAIH